PAKLTKLVRGELDWIVMKTLEKDRNRRYETANGLARDVERYLDDEPVQACPPSAWYRLRKFLRRHKAPMLAVGLSVLALVGGIVGTTWQAVRATEAEGQAREALGQATEANLAERESRRKVEKSLYFQSIARAHLEWWNNDVGRADQILDECPAEYRHWEWR